MEAVGTGMASRKKAVVGVPPLRQLGVTGIDLDHLDRLVEVTVPTHPPPLVTAVHRGDERDVTALVSGRQLAAEATVLRADILGARDRGQQLVGVHRGQGRAAGLSASLRGGARHSAITVT
jgi:hypothetical protein